LPSQHLLARRWIFHGTAHLDLRREQQTAPAMGGIFSGLLVPPFECPQTSTLRLVLSSDPRESPALSNSAHDPLVGVESFASSSPYMASRSQRTFPKRVPLSSKRKVPGFRMRPSDSTPRLRAIACGFFVFRLIERFVPGRFQLCLIFPRGITERSLRQLDRPISTFPLCAIHFTTSNMAIYPF